MNLMNRVITGGYWVAYYLVYALGVVYLTCHFRRELPFLAAGPGQLDLHQLFILAAIFAVAGGTALFVAINVEVTGRMVLLIPKAWNRAKAEGRTEGRAEGLTEGLTQGRTEGRAEGLTEGRTEGLTEGRTEGRTEARAEERDRVRTILSQYAQRDPETGRLILDRDAEERLRNGNGQS